MRKLLALAAFAVAIFCAAPSQAQSGCQYITHNSVLTAQQWNACFAKKLDVGSIPATSGTWVPSSPQNLGHVTSATWQKVGIQTCVAATFIMPISALTSPAVVQGLPTPSTQPGQTGLASLGLYVAVDGAQLTFIGPTGSNPAYATKTYADMSGLTETIGVCYF